MWRGAREHREQPAQTPESERRDEEAEQQERPREACVWRGEREARNRMFDTHEHGGVAFGTHWRALRIPLHSPGSGFVDVNVRTRRPRGTASPAWHAARRRCRRGPRATATSYEARGRWSAWRDVARAVLSAIPSPRKRGSYPVRIGRYRMCFR